MGYDSAFKVLLKHATKWMKLEVTTLSEISHRNTNIVQFHLHRYPEKKKIMSFPGAEGTMLIDKEFHLRKIKFWNGG